MAERGRTMVAAIAAVCAIAVLAPGSAAAATIFGTVSDEVTHAGIAGVEVCPTPQPYTFETDCTMTDSNGGYSLDELPAWQYKLYFSAGVNNLRYVSEFYDNKASSQDANLITLGSPAEAQEVDVALAEGGSISGTLTDETTGEPIAEIVACAWSPDVYPRCDFSDASGAYEINGLPDGEYVVEYEGWNQVNYQREFYEDADFPDATKVSVAAPATTTGIDAKLAKGAEILGHVGDVSSGAPVADAMVCVPLASTPEPEINTNCDWTDAEGNYAIRGLPAGSYLVAFDVGWGGPYEGSIEVGQWWKEAATRDEATVLELTTPESLTEINGKVSLPFWGPYPPPEGEQVPANPPPPLQPSSQRPLPKCKKGFHRKLVKGKKRCVRKHYRHRSRHRRHR